MAFGDRIPLDKLREYQALAAEMLLLDIRYLPIFKRMESEIARALEEQEAIDRARAVSEAYRARG